MEVLTRCGRCGALVETRCVDGGFARKVYLAPYVMTGEVSSDGVAPVGDGDAVILCPDCMQQYEDWLVEAPGERQEAGQSPNGDSVERLSADLARAFACTPEDCCGIKIACEYFGHGGSIGCRDRQSSRYNDECPASCFLSDGCWETMRANIRRRCKALGIYLEGEDDE